MEVSKALAPTGPPGLVLLQDSLEHRAKPLLAWAAQRAVEPPRSVPTTIVDLSGRLTVDGATSFPALPEQGPTWRVNSAALVDGMTRIAKEAGRHAQGLVLVHKLQTLAQHVAIPLLLAWLRQLAQAVKVIVSCSSLSLPAPAVEALTRMATTTVRLQQSGPPTLVSVALALPLVPNMPVATNAWEAVVTSRSSSSATRLRRTHEAYCWDTSGALLAAPLPQHEHARTPAARPDGSQFLTSLSFNLRLSAAEQEQRAHTVLPYLKRGPTQSGSQGNASVIYAAPDDDLGGPGEEDDDDDFEDDADADLDL